MNRGAGGCGSPFVTSTDGTNMIVWGSAQRIIRLEGTNGYMVMMETLELLFTMAAGQMN